MNGMGRTPALAGLITSVVLLGCGGGGDGDGAKPSRSSSTTDRPPPVANLKRAVYPRCTFKRFGKPYVKQIPGPTSGGTAWQVAYLPPPRSSRTPDETRNVMIVEESPVLKEFGLDGGRTITIAGRRVSLRSPTAQSAVYAAQWNTDSARYTALANGKTSTVLERFITCLP